MDPRKDVDDILSVLRDNKIIVLKGDAGVGKTWIARKICDLTASKGLSYMNLWVFLNQRCDSSSLRENVARHLSVLPANQDVSNKEPQEEDLESLKKKIFAKLEGVRLKTPEKFLLLILDGVPDTTNEDDLIPELEDLLQLNEQTLFKVLVTRRKEPVKEGTESKEMNEVKENESRGKKVVREIKPLGEHERRSLLEDMFTKKVKDICDFAIHAKSIAEKSKGLPAALVIIAEALNRIEEIDSDIQTLEVALREAATCEEAPDWVNPLVHFGYDLLPRRDITLISCCWHSLHFFLRHRQVHYNELIACWMLEGYLDPVGLVEQAYKEGHRVLMELIDRRMLKIQDDDIVVMEGLALMVPDRRHDGYEGTSTLGLASVFEDSNWKGFGIITQADGMIRTLCNHERLDKVSTLLIDGGRLCREIPDTFFDPMQGLQVLVLFSSTFRSLPSTLYKMDKLHLLVLRGCDLLENIDHIKELKSLTVLEISDATSLKEIADDFFEKLLQLRSLNLSAVQIKFLPSSISNLSELCWLILKGCSSLEKLPKLEKAKNLQVLDLSGASELKKLEDKRLASHKRLRMLDVSRTQIGRLPFLNNLESFTRLSVRGCEFLTKLPKLKSLPNLQIIDLSGAVQLKEIEEESLQSKHGLKILDLSKTAISNLPSNFNSLSDLESLDLSDACSLVKLEDNVFKHLRNLRHLNLSTTKIEKLPSLADTGNLEVLNLSGCTALTEIVDQSFEHMTHLWQLNLSESRIERLPSVSNLCNLLQLLLRNCINLKELSSLESLVKLEKLDLCGASSLQETEAKFLERMIHLQFLNLSGTRLKFPPMSILNNLTNLTHLSLCGCSLSEPNPNLETFTKLEVLDLSNTKVSSLLSLDNLSSLRELKLRDNPMLEQLQHLEVLIHLEFLDLWGTGIKDFPYEISELTCLNHLDLPDLKGIRKLDWGKIKHLPEELNWVECGIFKHSEKRPCISLIGTEFFDNLKGNLDLWKTCFQEFHFSVCPLKQQGRTGDISWHRVDPIFRKIYLKTFSLPEEHGRYLEIVGFDCFPAGVEDALTRAECVSLIDNKFIKSLRNLTEGLKAMNVGAMAMKGCLLDRCSEMETIFGGEVTEVVMEEKLETLWASNLPKLNGLSRGNVQVGSFKNLRQLYLECCPLLEALFPSPQLPQSLEILQIKFCDKLKTLFISSTLTEYKLQSLQKLRLVELPELTSIGVPESKSMEEVFPSIQSIEVQKCPKLKDLEQLKKLVKV